jgi:hypothetical protein
MPSPLKKHFREIEIKIISYLGWQKNSGIHEIIKEIISKETQSRNQGHIRIESSYEIDMQKMNEFSKLTDTPLENKESKLVLLINLTLYLEVDMSDTPEGNKISNLTEEKAMTPEELQDPTPFSKEEAKIHK